jgi:GABA permease
MSPLPTHTGSGHRRRLLVVANETATSATVRKVVDRRAEGHAEVLVVAPALGSVLELGPSPDGPRRDAEERLDCCLDGLRASGIHAEGVVGDADPLLAIEDALRLFDADEIIVATTPASRSGWLGREAVRRAQARYPRRVRHVVVGHDQGEAAAA